ncbi:MAG: tetratricopeptide repeat protein [Planctomycetaceae bacterium]
MTYDVFNKCRQMSGASDQNQDRQTTPPASAEPRAGRSPRIWRRWWLIAAIVLVPAVFAAQWYTSREWGFDRAREAAGRRRWEEARQHLARYLELHPNSSQARLLMAEALVKEKGTRPTEAIPQAIEHLRRVDGSPQDIATAKLQIARLSFLVLKKPGQAERELQEALALDPRSFDANVLMWKLLDLTGRHELAGDYFWQAFEVADESQHPVLLRDWFLSEFYPETGNDNFYSIFGAQKIGKIPASVNLLVRLRESEPEAVVLHAALAAYYLENGVPTSSLELLKEAPDLSAAMHDAFFVSVLLEALVDLGEFEKAEDCFRKFPQPHEGYLYWRSEGLFQQTVADDAAAAIKSYEKCLQMAAGKFDWGLMMRLSECLRKVGRADEAQEIQTRVNYLTTQALTEERAQDLRERLRNLNDPGVAGDVGDLYREFGKSREASAWEELHQRLLRHQTGEERSVSGGPSPATSAKP